MKVATRLKLVGAAGALALGGAVVALSGIGAGGPAAHAQAAGPALRAPTLRLMSQSQYIGTIGRIFGNDIALRIRFAPVKRVDGLLAVGADSAVVTSGALDPLDSTARAVAEKVVDPTHRGFLFPCKPENARAADPKCAAAFFSKVGRLIYRRPLTEAELAKSVDDAGHAIGAAGDFYAGVARALAGMLVSPQFLYIRESAEPDPATPGAWRLDSYSKASRLSYLLWNSAPDDALLTAAGNGDLQTPAGLKREVDRMIASPLYIDGVRAFFSDFLVMEQFDNLSKDSTIYPAFSLKAVDEAREQVLRTVVDHLVARGGDYRDLFTTRRTMISSELAVLYRVPVDIGSIGWVPYEFKGDDPRAGILTQIGFLAQYAHPGRSSPTRRGRAIREVLLCQKVPDPPPNIDFSKFEDPKSGLKTARERLTAHQANPVCAGCHRVTDPIGLALENFDGAGQFRATENGAPINPGGVLDGVAFSDAVGLGKALHDNPSLKSCIVDRLYAYSIGQEVAQAEQPLLASFEKQLDQHGYKFDDMLRLMIFDKGFFAVRAPQTAATNSSAVASKGGSDAH